MLVAQLTDRHTAFALAQNCKNLGVAISRHLHQNLLRYLAEKILLPHPLSFGEDYRDECLYETLFGTLRDARKTLEEWQEDYNWRRPHSALGNLTLMKFLQRKAMDKMAA